MATVDSLDIQISADAKNAEKGIDSLIKKLDVLGAKLRGVNLTSKNAFSNIGKSAANSNGVFNKVQKAMKNVSVSANYSRKSINKYALSFATLYAKIRFAVNSFKYLQQSVKSTSDYIETYNFYNVSFGKIASEWSKDWEKYGYDNAEDYSKSFTERLNADFEKMSGVKIEMFDDGSGILASTGLKNLGLNIQEITQYASQLASVTNAVGQTGETSIAVARTFSKLAGDVSSLFNVDYSDVANNIQSVLQGQSRAGYRYGWDTTLATLQQYADALDLSKPVSEMSQMEKQQLRILAILDQSKVAWGDLANTINSPSNMLRQFGNNVKEIGMVLGQLFIPVMQRVMPVINGVAIAIKDMLVSFAEILGVELDLDAFGQGFSGMEEDAEDLSEGLDDVSDSANKALKSLGKFDELTNINSKIDPFSSANLIEAIDLTDEIIKASEEYESKWQEAFDGMQSNAVLFANQIKEIFNPLKGLIENIKLGNWFEVGKDVSNIVSGIFDFFSDAISQVDWEEIGKNIGEFLNGIDWYKVFRSVGNFIVTMVKAATELFGSVFDASPIAGVIVTALALSKFVGLRGVISKKITESIPAKISIKEAIALSIPLNVLFKTSTKEGADKYLKSIEKLNSFDWNNMDGEDWINSLYEFVMARIGLRGTQNANRTQAANIPVPKREDFETLEEYKKALEEYTKEFAVTFSGGGEYTILKPIESAHKKTFDKEMIESFIEEFKEYKTLAKQTGEEASESLDGVVDKLSVITKLMGVLSLGFKIPNFGINLPKFATGGFPEDGLFMANHNELVGQFSNGRTAVANNTQITQGIADAVYPAVYNAVVAAMSNSNDSNNNTNVTVEIDGKEVFRAIQNQSYNYSKRTGRPAFG